MSRNGKTVIAALGLVTMGLGLTAAAQQIRSGPGKRPSSPDSAERLDSTQRSAAGSGKPTRRPAAAGGQQSAHISIEIIGPGSASAGVPSSYELVARNQGSDAVENVRVEAE